MAGTAMEYLLASDPLLAKYEWNRIKGWCKYATDCAPTPSQVTIEQIIVDWVIL